MVAPQRKKSSRLAAIRFRVRPNSCGPGGLLTREKDGVRCETRRWSLARRAAASPVLREQSPREVCPARRAPRFRPRRFRTLARRPSLARDASRPIPSRNPLSHFNNNRARVTETGFLATVRRSDLASSLRTIYYAGLPLKDPTRTPRRQMSALSTAAPVRRLSYSASPNRVPPPIHPPASLHPTLSERRRISSPAVSSFRSAERRRRFASESRGRAERRRSRRRRALVARPCDSRPSPRAPSRSASRSSLLSARRNRIKRTSASSIRVPRR